MTMRSSMWRLVMIWLLGSGIVFLILVGQSLVGYYEPRTEDAWAWFLPTVMPTLSLILGSLIAEYRGREGDPGPPGPVDGRLFWLGAGLSVFYLLLVNLAVLIQPLLSQVAPLELMQRSNLWLGPLQGLCVAALGFFFHRTR
jgi:hypothetical protein